MNLAEANLEAQRRWGRCGCAWYEGGATAPLTVGILTILGRQTLAWRILGTGLTWEAAFDAVLRPVPMSDPFFNQSNLLNPKTDEQIRDLAVPSPDADLKYRIGVERVKAAMADAEAMFLPDVKPSHETLVAITGFILAERART